MTVHSSLRTVLAVSICLLAATSVAHAQYSGGSGTAEDPYQIATAADLIALGEQVRIRGNIGGSLLTAAEVLDVEGSVAHGIVGMGETEYEVLNLVQELRDLGGHSHMFCFFPEQGSLMDHLPATPRDQWRRVQLARYLIDYRDVRIDHMSFDEAGRVVDFGLPAAELDEIIDAGIAFRTSGCPGKFQEDISACDRPYGDSPPSNIASFPFQPKKKDLKKIRKQLDIPVVVK